MVNHLMALRLTDFKQKVPSDLGIWFNRTTNATEASTRNTTGSDFKISDRLRESR
jgi:hypothetical protein